MGCENIQRGIEFDTSFTLGFIVGTLTSFAESNSREPIKFR